MDILEKEIEEMVYQAALNNPTKLIERGFPVYGYPLRQFDLGVYGICDLLFVQKSYYADGEPYLKFTVVEIKRDLIDTSTLLQASKYAKGIKRYMDLGIFSHRPYVVEIILLGKRIDTGSNFVYLTDFIDGVSIYTFSLDFEYGMLFERHSGYHSSSETPLQIQKKNLLFLYRKILERS